MKKPPIPTYVGEPVQTLNANFNWLWVLIALVIIVVLYKVFSDAQDKKNS